MDFQFYLEKLHDSENYKKFVKENPDAFFCSGFFVIDLEKNQNKQHFDFFTKDKKTFSFQLEENCKLVPVEIVDKRVPEKVSEEINFDFDQIVKLIEEKIEKENIKNKIQKILLSLQSFEAEGALIGTAFVSGLGMLKIQIDLNEMKIIKFEKKSFFDMIKVVRKKDK